MKLIKSKQKCLKILYSIIIPVIAPLLVASIFFGIQYYQNREKIVISMNKTYSCKYKPVSIHKKYPDSLGIIVILPIDIVNTSKSITSIKNISFTQIINENKTNLLEDTLNEKLAKEILFDLNSGGIKQFKLCVYIGTSRYVHDSIFDVKIRKDINISEKRKPGYWPLSTIMDTLKKYNDSLYKEIAEQTKISIKLKTTRNNPFEEDIDILEEIGVE